MISFLTLLGLRSIITNTTIITHQNYQQLQYYHYGVLQVLTLHYY